MFARCKLTRNEFNHSGFGCCHWRRPMCCNDTQQIAYAVMRLYRPNERSYGKHQTRYRSKTYTRFHSIVENRAYAELLCAPWRATLAPSLHLSYSLSVSHTFCNTNWLCILDCVRIHTLFFCWRCICLLSFRPAKSFRLNFWENSTRFNPIIWLPLEFQGEVCWYFLTLESSADHAHTSLLAFSNSIVMK